jgi:hypothetical protein
MKILSFIFLFLVSISTFAKLPLQNQLQEGDIIFHETQSNQAAALREITNSIWTHTGIITRFKNDWYVAEAARGVELTPLSDFINRGKDKKFIIKRIKHDILQMNARNLRAMKAMLMTFAGKDYDFWFEWSDDKIYCSELVWKVYERAFGIVLSIPEKFKDFPLNGPHAQRLIRERYTSIGRSINLEETVVTPIAVLESDLLIDVVRKD